MDRSPRARCPVIIDCDPGHDDAIAILFALASQEIDVRGITTVAGNQTIEHTTRNALTVIGLAGHDAIPVARGAVGPLRRSLRIAPDIHGDTGLDGGGDLPAPAMAPIVADAAEYLTERLEPGVVLVATGPLTNVAIALGRHARPDQIIWMGGSVEEKGDVTDAAEFNAFVDPDAAAAVFAAGVEPTMVGLDVTHQARVGPRYQERLRAAGRAGRFTARLLDFYGAVYRQRHGWDGPPVHDALAVAVAIDPALVRTEHLHVRVHTDGPERGRTEVVKDQEPNAHVAVEVDTARFLDLLCSRLESLP
ncbi:MAG: nucleoside hydrolase [Streptosporangiaceae bacterium]|nr:nucleoside hydrolase [Streptosporangiaceae bacterium]